MLGQQEENDLSQIIKKVGYVSIIGRPNTGKSTFLNTLIGEKIAITTSIPQTTRNKILWIYNDEESQIIFFDTPWIHKSENFFNQEINAQAINTLNDGDVILYFIDTTRATWEEEKYIEDILKTVEKPLIKVYTKIDIPLKKEILEGENSVKISSVQHIWFDVLLGKIKNHLKSGHLFYPEDYFTFQPMDFRASEIIREKIFLHTKEELPHSIFVEVEEIEEQENLIKIISYIYTETESQKYIIIWKKGSFLSQIGKEARLELEGIFWKKIFLSLRVKVLPKWRKNEVIAKRILY
jgi:GTPase